MSALQATDAVVIVGAGQAGGETAAELRKQGFTGAITIVGEEPWLPYKRPPLSKAFLAGTATRDSLFVMPQATFDKHDITFIGSTRAVHIDRAAKLLELDDGRHLPYSKLMLATGGRPRMLTLPGADRPNVLPLRTIADVETIRPGCSGTTRLVIVGGGYIGLEVAAVATKLGMKVTVLESLDRVLARVTVPELSVFYERVHRAHGVDLRTKVQIAGFEGEPNVTHVRLGDGTRIEADLVVVGIGILPNVEIAAEAGLAVDNGIVVDAYTRTSDPDIHSAGDCTNHPSEFLGRRVRLESVQNAMEQARIAAAVMMGKDLQYQTVPWFWSDQYDLKLQMVGISAGFDRFVERGDLSGHSFTAFYLREGRIIAADTVSRPQEFMFARKLVTARAEVDPLQLSDESIPLKSLLPA